MSALSKVLSHAGLCSRKKGQAWILEGQVSVDGLICRNPVELTVPPLASVYKSGMRGASLRLASLEIALCTVPRS